MSFDGYENYAEPEYLVDMSRSDYRPIVGAQKPYPASKGPVVATYELPANHVLPIVSGALVDWPKTWLLFITDSMGRSITIGSAENYPKTEMTSQQAEDRLKAIVHDVALQFVNAHYDTCKHPTTCGICGPQQPKSKES